MLRSIIAFAALVAAGSCPLAAASAADQPTPAPSGNAAQPPAQGQSQAGAASGGSSQDVARSAAKGSLQSPYAQDTAKVADEGHKKFMSAGCNGCHGGGGGGGMGPPLTNSIWIYGNDDDTLFRLIALGSDELQKKQGYTRKGSENVVGPMPPMGTVLTQPDDIWKVIAWIKTANQQAGQNSSTNSRATQ